jgi:membrane fusion protein, multidrug efflux system
MFQNCMSTTTPRLRVTISSLNWISERLCLPGRVDSIRRGTGSQCALLPPENATGNFVKVVRRVRSKSFDDPGEALGWVSPGMSVEAKIYMSEPPAWLSFLEW